MFSALGVWCVVVLCLSGVSLAVPSYTVATGRGEIPTRVHPLMILAMLYFILEVSSPSAHVLQCIPSHNEMYMYRYMYKRVSLQRTYTYYTHREVVLKDTCMYSMTLLKGEEQCLETHI